MKLSAYEGGAQLEFHEKVFDSSNLFNGKKEEEDRIHQSKRVAQS